MTKADQIIALLTDIRDALLAPMPVDDIECDHPEDQRINLRAMGDSFVEHFKCRKCKRLIQRP